MYDDDEHNSPRAKFQRLVASLPQTPEENRALAEAMYAYSETHDFGLSSKDALLMWQIVEWSKTATQEQIEDVRL